MHFSVFIFKFFFSIFPFFAISIFLFLLVLFSFTERERERVQKWFLLFSVNTRIVLAVLVKRFERFIQYCVLWALKLYCWGFLIYFFLFFFFFFWVSVSILFSCGLLSYNNFIKTNFFSYFFFVFFFERNYNWFFRLKHFSWKLNKITRLFESIKTIRSRGKGQIVWHHLLMECSKWVGGIQLFYKNRNMLKG